MGTFVKRRLEDPQKVAMISGRLPRSRAVRSELPLARLGALIWATRNRLELPLEGMGRLFGVRASRIREFEQGRRFPDAGQFAALARLMNLEPAAILVLQIAARVDQAFRRGAPSVESLHRCVIALIESQADLRPPGPLREVANRALRTIFGGSGASRATKEPAIGEAEEADTRHEATIHRPATRRGF